MMIKSFSIFSVILPLVEEEQFVALENAADFVLVQDLRVSTLDLLFVYLLNRILLMRWRTLT